MKIVTVVGARPQFIKAAPVSLALRKCATEMLVHTGQHYDVGLSQVFFDELGLPRPDHYLQVGSGSHAEQTANILLRLEPVLEQETPDLVLVYGDTNSTLAGALAAAKLNVPVAHVEAGLRSFNRAMPEELNRVVTDHLAHVQFCPTQTAVDHLRDEGIADRVHQVGDVMYDAGLMYGTRADETSPILEALGLTPHEYLLATLHRPANVDRPDRLAQLLDALATLDGPVVLPLHPRTRTRLADLPDVRAHVERAGVRFVDPVGYLDMLRLERNARCILTDSGGIQKEAYFFAVPCVTLREETEWPETLRGGWNVLVGRDRDRILAAATRDRPTQEPEPVFGDGHAALRIADILGRGESA